MLIELHVKNFALIDEANLEFGEGLNILTGETGSGKSILIGSVTCALGGKTGRDVIREGEDHATVELVFEDDGGEAERILEKYDLPSDGGHYTIFRRIQNTGRNVVKINGETCTQAAVKELAECLLDIHGQHEHQSLLYKKNHLTMLDRFAKEEEADILPKLKDAYRAYTDCVQKLEADEADPADRIRETEFLQYEFDEITKACIRPGELEELETEYKRLANGASICEALDACRGYLDGGDGGASSNVGYALRALTKISEMDCNIEDFKEQLSGIENLLNDLNRDIASYIDDFDSDPGRLNEVTQRLDLLNGMVKRFGGSEEAVLEHLEKIGAKLEKYADYDLYIEKLKKELALKEAALGELCSELTAVRKAEAEKLEKQICEALKELNFEQVRFEILVTDSGIYRQNGRDDVEFLISMNPGESFKPLEKVASGGELSRIMLGLKSVLADKDSVGTLIFDEIDTGVSGRTAQKVAERLAVISGKRQVICITHLPQIAAMSDAHYEIAKQSDGNRTRTVITRLSEEKTLDEVARLLGGVSITESVIQNAREMRSMATNIKEQLRNR